MAVAVVAFGIDRLLAPGPEPAVAAGNGPAARAGAPKGTPAASAAKTGDKPATAIENPVIDALRRLPEVPEVRDLFAQPGPDRRRPDRSFAGENGDPNADPAEAFRNAHRLEATFQDGSEMVAVVDRALVRPGQCIDGFCLSKVFPFRAIFRQQDVEVALEMGTDEKGPKKGPSSNSPKTQPAK